VSTDPPHAGIKPEDGFYEHVNSGDKIIAVANMGQFMGNHGFPLRWSQVVQDTFWQQENWPEDAEYSGFQHRRRTKRPDWNGKL